MKWKGLPTDAVWFRTSDEDRPNFFLEASAFRPQLCNHFEAEQDYNVNVVFKETFDNYPRVERVAYGHGASRGVYLYPRHELQ